MNNWYAAGRESVNISISLVFLGLAMISCGGGGPDQPENKQVIEFDFSADWQLGFADYPVGQESFF